LDENRIANFPRNHIGNAGDALFKIVNQNFFRQSFHIFFHELQMRGMRLIIVLSFFGWKNEIKRDLIGLVHDGPVARDHFANVKLNDAGNRREQLIRAGNQFVRGVRGVAMSPKNYDV
jgi:hypothetical protein